jgi:hypothetical protein
MEELTAVLDNEVEARVAKAPRQRKPTARNQLIDYISNIQGKRILEDSVSLGEEYDFGKDFLSSIDNSVINLGYILSGDFKDADGKRVWKWKDRISHAHKILNNLELSFKTDYPIPASRDEMNLRISQINNILEKGLSGKYLHNKHKRIDFVKRSKSKVSALEEIVNLNLINAFLSESDVAEIRGKEYALGLIPGTLYPEPQKETVYNCSIGYDEKTLLPQDSHQLDSPQSGNHVPLGTIMRYPEYWDSIDKDAEKPKLPLSSEKQVKKTKDLLLMTMDAVTSDYSPHPSNKKQIEAARKNLMPGSYEPEKSQNHDRPIYGVARTFYENISGTLKSVYNRFFSFGRSLNLEQSSDSP